MMAAWKIAPALAAGNTVVFKPSEHTPLTILALVPALQEILPPGVLNIVYGGGKGSAASWWGTRRCGWCRSPVISSPGKILQAAAKASSAPTGTGARRLLSSATMPISTRWSTASAPTAITTPAGLHRRLPHLCAGGHLSQAGGRAGRGGCQPALRPQARSGQRDRPVDK